MPVRTGRRLLLFLLPIQLLIGCGDETPAVEERTATIVNGQREKGFPAVGRISGCTASLIGRCTVLTAKHCIDKYTEGSFFVVEPENLPEQAVTIQSATPHPRADIALVKLAHPIIGVAPVSLAARDTRPRFLEPVTLVGYGKTGTGRDDYGVKRSTRTKIAMVTPGSIAFLTAGIWGGLCHGDSGGPTFATRPDGPIQVGVHSWVMGRCEVGAVDVRVDPLLDWIAAEAGADLGSQLKDKAPPTIELLSPAEGSSIRPETRLRVRARDDAALQRITVEHGQIKLLDQNAESSCAVQTKELEGEVQLPLGVRGDLVLTASAEDLMGKTSTLTIHLHVAEKIPATDAGLPEAGLPPRTRPEASPTWPTGDAGVELTEAEGCSYQPARPASHAGLLLPVALGIIVIARRRHRRRATSPRR